MGSPAGVCFVRLPPYFTNGLVRFDIHIMIMTPFGHPQFKHWPRFVPQSFICQLVSSRSTVVGFAIQRNIGGICMLHTSTCLTSLILFFWTCAYYFLPLAIQWLAGCDRALMVRFLVVWINISTNQLITVVGE